MTRNAVPRWFLTVLTVVTTAAATGLLGGTAAADAGVGADADTVTSTYVVGLKANLDPAQTRTVARALSERYQGELGYVYTAASIGFSVRVSARDAARLAADPRVATVEPDRVITLDPAQSPMQTAGTQPNPPSWGLDRIDQRSLPLGNGYSYGYTGAGVRAFVIGQGIRLTHFDFGGRAVCGFDAFGGGCAPCGRQGLSTHAAATIGGTAFGVAKQVQIVSVRVLDCSGSGSTAGLIAGLDYVGSQARIRPGGNVATIPWDIICPQCPQPCLSCPFILDAMQYGVHFTLPAGNLNGDACRTAGSLAHVTTVAASTPTDSRASFSNFGTCVDLFAPGASINSASDTSNTGTALLSGTASAAAHAAGAAALLMQASPSQTPAQIHDALNARATINVVSNPGAGTPNRLLYTGL